MGCREELSSIREGDFVLIEYELRVKETGELIDTTSEDEARKAGIYDASERYGPRLVIVGEGRLIPGLEKAISQMSEGEEKSLEIPPEEAYGKRDPSKIRVMPLNALRRRGVEEIEPGKIIEIDGKMAIIRSITGGRVLVDFNHPLAGKTIVAKIKVVKILRDLAEKVLHLLLRRVPRLSEKDVKVIYDKDAKRITIEFSSKALEIADLQVVKRILVREIEKYLKDNVKLVEFREIVPLETEEAKRVSKT